jgi:hypothetical protein
MTGLGFQNGFTTHQPDYEVAGGAEGGPPAGRRPPRRGTFPQPPSPYNGCAGTWLPGAGRVIRQGQVLYRVNNGTPVFLLYGRVPAWRDLSAGVHGADVRQLNRALVGLGCATLVPEPAILPGTRLLGGVHPARGGAEHMPWIGMGARSVVGPGSRGWPP